jgi:hypothetical protein
MTWTLLFLPRITKNALGPPIFVYTFYDVYPNSSRLIILKMSNFNTYERNGICPQSSDMAVMSAVASRNLSSPGPYVLLQSCAS